MADTTNNQGIPEPEGASDIIDTEYEIGQDNIDGQVGPFGFDIHNPVFRAWRSLLSSSTRWPFPNSLAHCFHGCSRP